MTTNHPNRIRKSNFAEKGGTLISVIGVMLILGVLGVSVVSFTQSSEHSSLSSNAGSRAYYLAESGLRYAQPIYCSEGWLHGRERTVTFQGGEQVNITRLGQYFWATAVTDAGTALEARARIPMPLSLCGEDPDANPVDEFAVFGKVGISLGNNTVILGDVAITDGNVALKGDVEGSVLAKDVTMTAHGTIAGDVYASGIVDLTVGTVTGDIHAATGILLRSSQATVFGGWLFSDGNIEVSGHAEVRGHIHSCSGDVILDGGAIIGSAGEPIEIRASGNIYLSGSAIVYGNVYAGGNIEIKKGNTISGNAFAGGTISNANSIIGTALQNSPTYVLGPVCPDLSNLEELSLPDATIFTAGGPNITVPSGTSSSPTNYLLDPGVYGTLSSSNNQGHTRLYLNSGTNTHGNYYFNSVSFGSNTNLYLNLSGSHDIRIFVVGNISAGRELNVFISNDGTTYTQMSYPPDATQLELGARVYWESQNNFLLGQASNWFGTVYTPNGSLSTLSSPNNDSSFLIGSFLSGGGHSLQKSTVVHVVSNYFAANSPSE